MRTGAIILCGGRSTRMGRDKATLPFGPETMLERMVRIVGTVVDPARIVVVAALGQPLPALPSKIRVVRDRTPDCGPLEGLAAGLSALAREAEVVFATSCDSPLLLPAFVTAMLDRIAGGDWLIAAPQGDEYAHPLAAAYRLEVLPQVERLLAADRRSLQGLLDSVPTRRVPLAELREADPALANLQNINTPEAYEAALLAAGFTAVSDPLRGT